MQTKRIVSLSLTALGMVLLILDAQSALHSAQEGVEICLKTIIPSLFPLFFLSAMINSLLCGISSPLLRPLSKIYHIPEGAESLLLLGLLGGYPVGATAVYSAFRACVIRKEQAQRMLSFCNNAGPAFIFGMVSVLFDSKNICWALWGIQIASALLVAMLLPYEKSEKAVISAPQSITPTDALQTALRNIGSVCGWVILFRILYAFCNRWFLWLLPNDLQVLICGLLELSNGCISLTAISHPALRFILTSVFLSFGGICVGMQTASATGSLSTKSYWQGKLMQTSLSLLLAGILQYSLFPDDPVQPSLLLYLPGLSILSYPILKKAVDFTKVMGYNERKSLR